MLRSAPSRSCWAAVIGDWEIKNGAAQEHSGDEAKVRSRNPTAARRWCARRHHAGVYEGFAEAGRPPTWVVGVSIGAITAALIAGNPPERRVERLRAFWDLVSHYAPLTWPTSLNPMRPALNYMSAAAVAAFGSPGFFAPRVPPPFFAASGTPENTSFYDTTPLKHTLEEMVDFDLINRREVRVSLGAVNVRTGASVYFDNQTMRIGPEHVMASGALPPGFPAVEIDGEYYWDGGIVSNTPLTYVVDERPLTTALIVQVDLFDAKGELPSSIDQVLERAKDIQYSSKQRFNVERVKELGELWAADVWRFRFSGEPVAEWRRS